MESRPLPWRLGAAAAVLTVVASSPCWGGPGPGPDSAAWEAMVLAVGVLVAVLVAKAPLEMARQRVAWLLVGAWAALFAIGALWFRLGYSGQADPPVPSPVDVVFITAYGCLIVGIVTLFYRPADEAPRSSALDGLLVGLAIASLAEATVLDWFVGTSDRGSLGEKLTALAYPLLDVCLLATVVAIAGREVWATWRWRLLALAAGCLLVADLGYLRRVRAGDLSTGAWYHPFYLLAGLAIVGAAWSRGSAARHRRTETARMVLLPGGVAAVAAFVLVWDHFDRRTDLAVWLATAALVAVALRSGLTVHYLRQLVDARRLALTDDLTGLPNRRWFLERLGEAARAPRADFAVMVLGIDRFKVLNDTLGHPVGDQVLRDAAALLRAYLPPGDLLARLGGDEFAVLATGSSAAVEEAVLAIRRAFVIPVVAGDLAVPLDVSIGGAVCPRDGHDAETLLRHADVALMDAKRAEDGFAMYRSDRDRFSLPRLSLASELRAAIRNGQMRLVYHPIVDVRTHRFTCAEALVRWAHPRHGLLLPGEFLDLAQQTGSMRALTTFVLEAALAQSRAWSAQGLALRVCVNLPPTALMDALLPETVRAALLKAGVPPDRLGLEVTEDGLIEDPHTARIVLAGLRAVGVSLAIDDFGTAYASLSYLRDLPVDALKIDRSFIRDLGDAMDSETAARNAAIVRSTIVLAHELGFDVVAEGVEDAHTFVQLATWGVDAVQGYLITEPVAGAALAEVERSWGRRVEESGWWSTLPGASPPAPRARLNEAR